MPLHAVSQSFQKDANYSSPMKCGPKPFRLLLVHTVRLLLIKAASESGLGFFS